MLREQFNLVPTTFINDDIEEWKYTVIYTSVWEVQVFEPLDDVMVKIKECRENKTFFRVKKLDEYSRTLQHFWEFVLDLENTTILWFKEHHIIDNLKLQRELKEKAELELKEELEKAEKEVKKLENKS